MILPSIRPHFLPRFVESFSAACTKYDWEILVGSPFDLPPLDSRVKLLKSYRNPSAVTQLLVAEAKKDLIFITTDDGYIMDHSIDICIDQWNRHHLSTRKQSIITCMRYREGNETQPMPDYYWYAWAHAPLMLPGIKKDWKLAPQLMMSRYWYNLLGGIDCQFEYSNYGIHDLVFRNQWLGKDIIISEVEVLNASHMPGESGDHKPIHNCQTYFDEPKFKEIYSQPDAAANRWQIPYDNWKQTEEVWSRRFKEPLPTTYDEMLKQL